MAAAFRKLQAILRDKYKLAVTFGFGPRFLHSTGQLHKGDRGNGHFIQFISKAAGDLNIPDNPGSSDSTISFDTLKQAQAMGDRSALEDKGRPVLTFSLNEPSLPSIREFIEEN
jgi:hypothetical protein